MNRRDTAPTQQTELPPITLLPAETAYDYEFVAARLLERHLLDHSVAVCIYRAPLLAVPVGGRRRGGCMSAGPVTVALSICQALADRPGFPDTRIRLVSAPGEQLRWIVEWGERLPARPTDTDRARVYGTTAPAPSPGTTSGRASASTPRSPRAVQGDTTAHF